ncbi:MAG: hypothetical protein U1F25_13550 [Rubrivivax sp.]
MLAFFAQGCQRAADRAIRVVMGRAQRATRRSKKATAKGGLRLDFQQFRLEQYPAKVG